VIGRGAAPGAWDRRRPSAAVWTRPRSRKRPGRRRKNRSPWRWAAGPTCRDRPRAGAPLSSPARFTAGVGRRVGSAAGRCINRRDRDDGLRPRFLAGRLGREIVRRLGVITNPWDPGRLHLGRHRSDGQALSGAEIAHPPLSRRGFAADRQRRTNNLATVTGVTHLGQNESWLIFSPACAGPIYSHGPAQNDWKGLLERPSRIRFDSAQPGVLHRRPRRLLRAGGDGRLFGIPPLAAGTIRLDQFMSGLSHRFHESRNGLPLKSSCRERTADRRLAFAPLSCLRTGKG